MHTKFRKKHGRKYKRNEADLYEKNFTDANADGTVNMKDVLQLRKFLARIVEALGA